MGITFNEKLCHTPGPWAVHPNYSFDLAEIHGVAFGSDKSQEPGVFAVFTDDGHGNGLPLELDNFEGDARLIQAAPQLLVALHRLLNLTTHPLFIEPIDLPAWKEVTSQARAVIATVMP